MRCDVSNLVLELMDSEPFSNEEALRKREQNQKLFNRLITEVTSSEECDDVSLDDIEDCLKNADGYCGGTFEDEMEVNCTAENLLSLKQERISYVNRVV